MSEVGSWQEYAACSTGTGDLNDLFFSLDPLKIAKAKNICSQCPVAELCYNAAIIAREPHGVWGGVLFSGGVVAVDQRPFKEKAIVRKRRYLQRKQAGEAIS